DVDGHRVEGVREYDILKRGLGDAPREGLHQPALPIRRKVARVDHLRAVRVGQPAERDDQAAVSVWACQVVGPELDRLVVADRLPGDAVPLPRAEVPLGGMELDGAELVGQLDVDRFAVRALRRDGRGATERENDHGEHGEYT